MPRFDLYQDIEIVRGLAFKGVTFIVDEDGAPVPPDQIFGVTAEIHNEDRMDASINVPFDTNHWTAETPVKVTFNLDESQTLQMVAPPLGRVFAWWFAWYNNGDGEKVPIQRGRVYVKDRLFV